MPQTRTGKQRAVNTRTRLRAAAVFLCLALIVVSAYFLLRSTRSGSAGQVPVRTLEEMFTGQEPAVFLKVRTNSGGQVTGREIPETVYVFKDGSVSEWKGTDRSVNLHTLGLSHDREILSMMKTPCFTDAEFVLRTENGQIEVFRAGNPLFTLLPGPVEIPLQDVTFTGWKVLDDENTLILVSGPQPENGRWKENDHVLTDPSWHDQFAFLQTHTADPACEGRQDPGQRQVPKDDLEGLHPGHYEAVYDMNLRSSCHRDAGTVGSLPAGEQVDIELLERAEDNSVWGRIEPGKWVCVKDAEYQYLQPVGEAAE